MFWVFKDRVFFVSCVIQSLQLLISLSFEATTLIICDTNQTNNLNIYWEILFELTQFFAIVKIQHTNLNTCKSENYTFLHTQPSMLWWKTCPDRMQINCTKLSTLHEVYKWRYSFITMIKKHQDVTFVAKLYCKALDIFLGNKNIS
jgi:hypothetical protein